MKLSSQPHGAIYTELQTLHTRWQQHAVQQQCVFAVQRVKSDVSMKGVYSLRLTNAEFWSIQ
jgi:hypothetical protein